MLHPARWWSTSGASGIACQLCPQSCPVIDGGSGACGARYARDGALFTKAYGIGTPPVADPIEKKPLYHYLPGTGALSFGLLGCNLSCSFCQNWHLSTGRDYGPMPRLDAGAIVRTAVSHNCRSIAFTYNEPTVSSEFCIEVAEHARKAGLKAIAVTNGYIHGRAREEFFGSIDAANIDLKGIDPGFYAKHCGGRLEPVLETLAYIAITKKTWLEVTNLLIPSLNDSDADIDGLVGWVLGNLGADVPLHFSAFHPQHRLLGLPATPYAALERARDRAISAGLRYVYLGNTRSPQITPCPSCKRGLIKREGYNVSIDGMDHGACQSCGAPIAGVF